MASWLANVWAGISRNAHGAIACFRRAVIVEKYRKQLVNEDFWEPKSLCGRLECGNFTTRLHCIPGFSCYYIFIITFRQLKRTRGFLVRFHSHKQTIILFPVNSLSVRARFKRASRWLTWFSKCSTLSYWSVHATFTGLLVVFHNSFTLSEYRIGVKKYWHILPWKHRW